MQLKDKIIIVTGASQGIGKEISLQVAKQGADVIIVARSENLLKQVQEQIVSEGGKSKYFVCDISNPSEVRETVSRIIEKFDKVDVLINNAGVWISDEIAGDLARIKHAFEVNSLGTIYFSQSVIPQLEKQQSGHIVFINSIAGLPYSENKKYAVYAASKWAVTGYAKSLASRYNNSSDIKITSIHPGPTTTNIDKNAGDDFGEDHSAEMSAADVAYYVIQAIAAPNKIQVDTIELKTTNWNS